MAKITIDTLAGMMNNSFKHLEGKIDGLHEEMNERFQKVDERFDEVTGVLNNHENRVSRLEDNMRVVKTAINK